MYRHFFKPLFDFLLSFIALILLSPFFILFTPIVAIAMKGNPFFVQKRPGKNGKIFRMIKYRTMTNAKDKDGVLLPDEKRLTSFGKLMRKLSLDELPEIFNIFLGQMSIVGPRPLLVSYLPLYNDFQARRHEVRPGLTGWAQVSGRNAISWEQKFAKDVEYVDNMSFAFDVKIFFMTIAKVFKREGISQEGQATMEVFTGTPKKEINVLILSAGRRVELVKLFKEARDRLGYGGKVVAVDLSDTAPALYFADEHYFLPRIGADGYIDKLIEICKTCKINLIVPTIDTELMLLAEEREHIERETGALINIGSKECVDICCDKTLTAEFFAENGFNAPYTYTEEELNEGKYSFPLFIKPRDGSSSINAFKVENEQQLRFFLSYVKKPIVQECVNGKEYTVDAFIDFEGNIISVVPRIRLAVRSGEILKGEIDMNEAIISDVTKMIKKLRPSGHITVQGFFGEDEIMRYIEINPRFGGGAPMSIRAGADTCEWLYRIVAGEKIDASKVKIADGAVYVRFDDSVRVK